MQFINLTRKLEIGANSYLFKTAGSHILLDAGLHPKAEGFEALPDFSILEEEVLDAVVITHAHQDHMGALPVLTRQHRDTPIYMTSATAHIANIMLHNSVNVMMRKREETGLIEYPLFTHRGVEFCSEAWETRSTGRFFYPTNSLGNEIKDVRMRFYDAGHVLGSVGVLIESEGRKFFYTGDVNFDAQCILKGAEFPQEGVDILVMETTRGDSPTPEGFTRAAEELRFGKAIQEAFDSGGAVTIPVFALGKTQELLALLWKLRRQGLSPSAPLYIGGLSSKITSVYDVLAPHTRRNFPKLKLLQEMSPSVVGGGEISGLSPQKYSIFALSSGMMSENTLSNIFVRRILEHPRQSLFFVGYADPDSPAGQIRRASPEQEITLEAGLPSLKLRCRCEEFNFSAHAAREALLAYAIRLRPKTIILVHGDALALGWFRSSLSAALPKTKVILPEPGQVVDL